MYVLAVPTQAPLLMGVPAPPPAQLAIPAAYAHPNHTMPTDPTAQHHFSECRQLLLARVLPTTATMNATGGRRAVYFLTFVAAAAIWGPVFWPRSLPRMPLMTPAAPSPQAGTAPTNSSSSSSKEETTRKS